LRSKQADRSFLVLFFKKEPALLFEKRSKNFYPFVFGVGGTSRGQVVITGLWYQVGSA
jgi:hypothetical protein